MDNWTIFHELKASLKKSDQECFQNYLSNGILEKISTNLDDYFFYSRGKLVITDDIAFLEKKEERIKKVRTYFFHKESHETILSLIRKEKTFFRGKIVEHHYANEFDNTTALTPLRERIHQMVKITKEEKVELVICVADKFFFKINAEKFYETNNGFTW